MSKPGGFDTAKSALKRALVLAEKALDGAPIPGLKGAISGLLKIIEEVERTKNNAQLSEALGVFLLGMEEGLSNTLSTLPEKDTSGARLKAVTRYEQCIQNAIDQLTQKQKDKHGKFRRWIDSERTEGDIRRMIENIDRSSTAYTVGTITRMESTQHEHGAMIQHIDQNSMQNALDVALMKLRPVEEAGFDAAVQPQDNGKPLLCFKDTRVTIIDKIMDWVDSSNSPPIFWLHGLAGTGKSTIARTIAVKAKEHHIITSFFFSRDAPDRRNHQYVLPTLAHQLAFADRPNRLFQIIGGAVQQTPTIGQAGVETQFQTLILPAWKEFCAKAEGTKNILMILEALDECQDNDTINSGFKDILAVLRKPHYHDASRIRILLTSRPEYYSLHKSGDQSHMIVHDLREDDESVQGDIELFLRAKLDEIPTNLGISLEDWPREDDIQTLSKKSGSLFIFAETALRFIRDVEYTIDPQEQMDILLGMVQTTVNPYSPLDNLYLQVLKHAIRRDPNNNRPRLRRVLAYIILSRDALPVSSIAKLAVYTVGQVKATLLQLQSVIPAQQDSDPVPRVYHASFSDFLIDPKRCSDPDFTIEKPKMHASIFHRCFELMKDMNDVSPRNILGLTTPSIRNRDISDLEAEVQRRITPEAAYACQFSLSHLLESEKDQSTLEELREFLSKRFLWWCEALSLLNAARGGHRSLLKTAASTLRIAWEQMKKVSCDEQIVDLLHDTYRFLLSHNETISQSAMHTYYSALPFTPHNTRLYQLYKHETDNTITVKQGLSPTWTSCLSIISLGDFGGRVRSVSPCGTWLAVSELKKTSIMDARTTVPHCHIEHTNDQTRLAFSSGESMLATLNSKCLELWDPVTRIQKNGMKLNGTDFYAVAFSTDDKHLLLSIDQSLHLHHGTNLEELSVQQTDCCHTNIIFTSPTQVITGSKEGYIHIFAISNDQLSEIRDSRIRNETEVLGLALRRDGKRLASSGADGTIRIYDLLSQSPPSPIATLQRAESESAISVIAYHPMEEELAVGQDNCVVLWRQNEAGRNWTSSIHSYHGTEITGIAYCENGTRIYTSAILADIKLWANLYTTTPVQELQKHNNKATCYAVDKATLLLATGSQDRSIIIWELTSGKDLKALSDHTGGILSLVFSNDSTLLASGSSDRTTIVWSVESGERLHKLQPHDSCGDVLEFSEDHARITTRSGKECFVWELESGALLERQERDTGAEVHTRPYYLDYFNGWQRVVSDGKSPIYILCRPPGEYGTFRREGSPIIGDRAVLFCDDGRVLILDISRVMDKFTGPELRSEGPVGNHLPPVLMGTILSLLK